MGSDDGGDNDDDDVDHDGIAQSLKGAPKRRSVYSLQGLCSLWLEKKKKRLTPIFISEKDPRGSSLYQAIFSYVAGASGNESQRRSGNKALNSQVTMSIHWVRSCLPVSHPRGYR